MTPAILSRLTFATGLLQQAKRGLLTALKPFPKFFDYNDDELDERLADLLNPEDEEWDGDQLLELAAIFLIMYLKDEYENGEE